MMDRELTEKVIGCDIEVHRVLGPGLLESTYQQCLAHELSLHGVLFDVEAVLPVMDLSSHCIWGVQESLSAKCLNAC